MQNVEDVQRLMVCSSTGTEGRLFIVPWQGGGCEGDLSSQYQDSTLVLENVPNLIENKSKRHNHKMAAPTCIF